MAHISIMHYIEKGMNIRHVFQLLEQNICQEISHNFSNLLKEANELTQNILGLTIKTAEIVEENVKTHINDANNVLGNMFEKTEKAKTDLNDTKQDIKKIVGVLSEGFLDIPQDNLVNDSANHSSNFKLKRNETSGLSVKEDKFEGQVVSKTDIWERNYPILKSIVLKETDLFQCKECSYTSKQKSNLNTHIKAVHQKEHNFECEKCSYTSAFKQVLQRHIKSIHKEHSE